MSRSPTPALVEALPLGQRPARGEARPQRGQPVPARQRSHHGRLRHPESDIFLDDVTVSRRHAEFYRHPRGFTVRDVGA